jgi:hypothetical protein
MIVKGRLFEGGIRWRGGGKEKVMRSREYDQSTLYVSMKINSIKTNIKRE